MTFPTPARLERFLAPYAHAASLAVRVWGVDVGSPSERPRSLEAACFAGAPRLVLLGAGSAGLVVVRQTCETLEDLDGSVVPWPRVLRLERDPHLVRDLVRVELRGRPPLHVAVANHVFLPGNRSAAKALCELARGSGEPPPPARVDDIIPLYGGSAGPEVRPA